MEVLKLAALKIIITLRIRERYTRLNDRTRFIEIQHRFKRFLRCQFIFCSRNIKKTIIKDIRTLGENKKDDFEHVCVIHERLIGSSRLFRAPRAATSIIASIV